MKKFSIPRILLLSVWMAAPEVFAAAPSGIANPFNVAASTNATVSPIGPSPVAQLIKKRRKLRQLNALRNLSQQNIAQLAQLIDEVNQKIDDLNEKLDDEKADNDETAHLKERIKSKENHLEELDQLKEIFLNKIGLLNAQIVSIQRD